ncbi:CSN-associated deubiquitinating enzyme Ubp12 [Mortierella sp. AD094]|nr:CSN-associated deubiquitinating enzyme Ubp12 [Mortierella sp. AD094]
MHSDPDPSCPPQLCPQDPSQNTAATIKPTSTASDSTSTVLFSAGTSTTALPPFPSTTTAAAAASATTDTTPAPHTTSFSSTAIAASSHKRGREPSAMTDPSEAARYTPPREMFKHSSITLDLDDLPHTSEDGMQEIGESEIQNGLSQSDGFQGDSEIDSLGQQLSIHSPEKSTVATIDIEQDQTASNIEIAQPQVGAPLQQLNDNADKEQEEQRESEQEQNQSAIPSFEQQTKLISDLRYKRLEEGAPWYLVSQTWFVGFRKYCVAKVNNREADHPGPVDNSILFSGNNLRQDAEQTVIPLPQEGWDLLVSWYGSSSPPIMRRVVNSGSESRPNLLIEYYPPVFTLYRVIDSSQAENPLFATNEPDVLQVPKSTKFGDLKSAMLSRLEVSTPETSRIWAIPTHTNANFSGNVIGASDLALSSAECLEQIENDTPIAEVPELIKGANLALEVAVDGTYPVLHISAPKAFGSNMPSTYPYSYLNSRSNNFSLQSQSPGPAVDGICGLSNLGNTCFMNSALQCLSNSKDLTQYILAGAWRDELNLDNPLGMGGEVARAYANLIDKLWRGSSKVFSPREFKSTIGRFAPSFTGYHQHDSQELLAFLLDGLHEDLNRIIKKPYTEVPDSNGRPDEEVASDCWQIHKARNDSIIVDLFQGQYKSTLVCPKCSKISVTFDPFMYLSLPLPINKKWIGTITYVPYDPKKPVVDIRLQLPKGSSQKQLKEKIAELMGTQASHLFSAEVFSNRLYKSHDNADAVDELNESDKNFVYEVPVPDFTNAQDHVVFPVHNMLEPVTSYGRISTFGHPMMVCVTKEEALDPHAVYRAIVQQASRYTTFNLYKDDTDAPEQEIESTEQNVDVNMSPSEGIVEEKQPKSDLFHMMVYSPPLPQPSRYQFRMQRSTLYAPSTPPSMSDMVDMYQRVTPQEPEIDQEMEPVKSQSRIRRGIDDSDDDYSDASPHPGSPSAFSESAPFGRPRMPKPDEDELSEEDDPATLTSSTGMKSKYSNRGYESPSAPVRVAEPAVRQGEMVYCVWDRSLESSICAPDRRFRGYSSYRSMDEDEDQDSDVRILWDQRGPKVVDPALEDELAAGSKGKKVITLEDCLNEYTREEQLGEEDPWYCPSCKEHQQATKKLDIWRLPDVLVVHLKRFSHTRAWRDKIDAMVDFPIHGLDLSAKTLKEEDREDNVYDLFGVSNHMGGLGGGHYTAYAKNDKLNKWFNFDDSHVSPVHSEESIKSSSAYLLFYRRRNAVVREYEQRPVEEPEPVSSSVSQFSRGFLESTTVHSITLRDRDEEEEYGGWGKPPAVPIPYGPDADDDDDLPPSYSPLIGPSGMASPPTFSRRAQYIPEKSYGKGRSMDEDDDVDDIDSPLSANMSGYLDSRVGQSAHSPDLSTCASDGSNPGTANVSPGFSPAALTSSVVDLTRTEDLGSIGPSYMSSISREGGRIDDTDDMVDGGEETVMSYPNRKQGAGVPTPSSSMSGLDTATLEADDETEGDEGEQDSVNMVELSNLTN